ncbi:MAG: cytidine deaminase [Deltaproteobacteria bacterium]|nr:cytidine deaminase [Deltaproteobacteria bacterium]MBW1873457.1 cytidine deaminase [Deltaproteobacteria bacterium]
MKARASKPIRLSRQEKELIDRAAAASKNAHAPYSRFKVGAALQVESGQVFVGCNVENASYGATVCAERNAVAQAVVNGHKKFKRIAIMTATSPPAPPCGLCRQVLVEFCDELPILLANPRGEVVRAKLSKLIPQPFCGKSL